VREIHVVGAAVLRDGRCLVTRRGPGMRLPGKWEFPGGKVEDGEDPRAALARELREELGLDVEVGALLGTGGAVDGEASVRLDVYVAALADGGEPNLRLLEHSEARWVDASELDTLDWAPADVPVLPRLRPLLAGAPSHL
jgi:8-oxo-dGTP diphosphatase